MDLWIITSHFGIRKGALLQLTIGQMENKITLINFLVYCHKGVAFLKSIDANGIRKDADALFSMFDEVLLSVGPEKVVQLITDNYATDKVAGWRVAEKYQTFY